MECVARLDGRIADVDYLQIHPDILRTEGAMFTADASSKSGLQAILHADTLALIDSRAMEQRSSMKSVLFRRGVGRPEKLRDYTS
jgi:hypothetical protein